MKNYFIFVSLLLSLPVFAQVPTAIKGGTQAVSKASKAAVAPKVRVKIPTVKTNVTNTLSRAQIRQAALEMRSNQFKTDWKTLPTNPMAAIVRHEMRIAGSGANLTGLSEEKWNEAITDYSNAVSSVQNVAQYMDTQIYYMGTSEAERLHPEQIRRTLDDINTSLAAVKKAQATFGVENAPLTEMGLYLNRAKRFYTMLGTGMYEPLDESALAVVPRSDNHTFVDSEFALWSEFIREKLPKAKSKSFFDYLTNLFSRSAKQDALPQKLRVALLQDDQTVISGLQKMQEQGKLTGWQIDYLEPDPEAFLKKDYNTYDLILSDIVMPNGGGRYLARQLRAGGYKGSLLVVSKFDKFFGESFFKDGFDGMLQIADATGSDFQSDYASWLWSRLKNYYQLKAKHGWQH